MDEEYKPLLSSNENEESPEERKMSNSIQNSGATQIQRITAAAAYGCSSLAIIFSNKLTLTTYKFPSYNFLAFMQCISTVVMLGCMSKAGVISFSKSGKGYGREIFSFTLVKMVFPLPLLFMGNLICGLGGTQSINIAMFTALRRFSILIMMLLELCTLGIPFSIPVRISVGVIVFGGAVAAMNDLAFNFKGYALIMGNNVFGALYGVTTKSKLSGQDLSKFGLLYYNSICAIPILFSLMLFTEPDLKKQLINYEFWDDPVMVTCLIGSIILGVVLNYAVFWCTQVNSATTTAVVGSMKNVISGYASILGVGGDYVFSLSNFIGLNISICGACVYSYFQLLSKQQKLKTSGADRKAAAKKKEIVTEI